MNKVSPPWLGGNEATRSCENRCPSVSQKFLRQSSPNIIDSDCKVAMHVSLNLSPSLIPPKITLSMTMAASPQRGNEAASKRSKPHREATLYSNASRGWCHRGHVHHKRKARTKLMFTRHVSRAGRRASETQAFTISHGGRSLTAKNTPAATGSPRRWPARAPRKLSCRKGQVRIMSCLCAYDWSRRVKLGCW